MQIPREIRNNLRFLIAEVGSQVANLRDSFRESSIADARRVLERSGYAYNLMSRIHEACYGHAGSGSKAGAISAMRAVESIATELERISGLCRACVKQMERLQAGQWQGAGTYLSMLKDVGKAINRVESAVRSDDAGLAMKIGMIKPGLDKAYNRLLKNYMGGLRKRKHTEDLVTGLLMAHGV